MKAMELLAAIGSAAVAIPGVDPVAGPEIVFDDHGSFRALTEVVARDDRIVLVLEPHPQS